MKISKLARLLASSLAAAVLFTSVPAHAGFAPERTAEELYYEGSARYSAANYTGAIESFTAALEIVTREGADPAVRGALLLNLGKAHVKAFDVDAELRHLRAAREVYGRYVRESEKTAYPDADVADAEKQVEELGVRIDAEEEKARKNSAGSTTIITQPSAGPTNEVRWTRRNVGIALLASGGVLVAFGAFGLGFGSTFKGRAEKQIAKDTMTSEQEKKNYLDQETLKGQLWMGGGAGAAVIGIAAVAAGAVIFVRNKDAKKVTASMTFAPVANAHEAGFRLVGHF